MKHKRTYTIKIYIIGLERWLNKENWLLGQRTQVQSPAPTLELTTVSSPVPRNPMLSSGFRGHCIHTVHIYTCRPIHTK